MWPRLLSAVKACFNGCKLALDHVVLGVHSWPAPTCPPASTSLDPDVNVKGLPVDELAELRKVAPIWWNEQPIGKGGFNDGGYWVITKHADVKEVSRRSDVFSSWQNGAIPRVPDDMTRESDRPAAPRHAQHGRTAPHPVAQDHLPRIHPAGGGAPAGRTATSARRTSRSPPPRKVPATSSSRCRASCRCRPSRVCSACRRRTATSCSAGPTR